MARKTTKAKDYTFASGRRKSSSARVRLISGKGESVVNDKLIGIYFPGEVMLSYWNKPFELTNTLGKYYITVKVAGGGVNSQLEAVVHATAKALAKRNPEEYRSVLKKAGLLTRDARERERRKVGKGGKARRAKQSPKR